MKIYLVGGAVRDELLGLVPTEKDWVVVGATVDEMLRLGFRHVGKDFPVFLHPTTHEEYALARKERKVGKGYTGFTFDASVTVTLEEDLLRRDLTINAIAKTPEGRLIDPYHGHEDLKNKILRHVSPAFSEDPVRILRVARFAARFKKLGFHVAPETIELMKAMVLAGEVDALVAERVWKELSRALTEPHPEEFFITLQQCGAYAILFPGVSAENQALLRAAPYADVRFAVWLHDVTDAEIKNISSRYRVPTEFRDLALLVAQHEKSYEKLNQCNAKQIMAFFVGLDAFRREARFRKFLLACEAVAHNSFSEKWLTYYVAAKTIDAKTFVDAGFSGKEIADKLTVQRENAIQTLLDSSP